MGDRPRQIPIGTQAAFAMLIAVGLVRAAFAGWVLSRRRPLFARDRVLGARLALAVGVGVGIAGVSAGDAGAASGLVNTAHQLGMALGLGILVALAAPAGSAQVGAASSSASAWPPRW